MNERLNVYQRKDGRYEGRLTLGFTEGKRSYKAFYGKTAEEVTEKMLEFRRTGNVKREFDRKNQSTRHKKPFGVSEAEQIEGFLGKKE